MEDVDDDGALGIGNMFPVSFNDMGRFPLISS